MCSSNTVCGWCDKGMFVDGTGSCTHRDRVPGNETTLFFCSKPCHEHWLGKHCHWCGVTEPVDRVFLVNCTGGGDQTFCCDDHSRLYFQPKVSKDVKQHLALVRK